ncbi:ABC transporter permease [Actinomadura algeriensis]|uniref:Branched-chain amino acid transport system permease protein n=1 Tax=Actinomadura algeriensis TaxID=1679523 RepID=A0ABR9JZ79_9ACTN|nr:ABC transporter permease [Actinomadura algeriensis]MBE1535884.1 branched-chain amino acid transport system permease protein [Actinomadura algeriensis]
MGTYLQFIVLGFGLGAAYIALGNGLVLVYRATGIINFAQGAMAMWGAYVFAQLEIDGSLVLPVGTVPLGGPPGRVVALLIALATAVVLGLAAHYLVFRPVRNAPALAQVVVSVALMLTIQALVVIRFGPNNIAVESIVPYSTFDAFGATITTGEPIMVAIMIVLSALVWAYLRFTRAGTATRASAENERGAVLKGYSPDRLAAVAMVTATVVGTVGVLLAASLTGLNPSNYTLMVVPALAVLLVARMESIGVVVAASLIFGSFQAVVNLLAIKPWWPVWAQSGVDQVIPFVVVIAILLLFGKRLPSRGSLQNVPLPDVRVPRVRPVPALLLAAAAVVALAAAQDIYRFGLTYSVILMLIALSYVVITGYLGQISLAQTAFAGAAGFALSKVTTGLGVPFVPALLLCSLVAAVLGLLVALPALRIRGAQLAIVTIAASLAIERFVFNNYSITPPAGNPIEDPSLFGLDLAVRAGAEVSRLPFSLMVLAVAALIVVAFVRIASGDTGRAFLAVRANERAAASVGIDVRLTKMIGFGMSAFIAGMAGCLIGYSAGQLSAESFSVFVGLQILAVAYLGGITSFGGAAVAGIIGPLGIVYVVMHRLFEMGDYYALVSGLALILTAILNPVGIAGATRQQIAWLAARTGRGPAPDPAGRPGGDIERKALSDAH